MWYYVPSRTSPSSQEVPQGSTWDLNSLVLELGHCCTWKTKSLTVKDWLRTSRRVSWLQRRFGLMLNPSVAQVCVEKYWASSVGFLALIYPSQETEKESTETDQDCGCTIGALLTKFDLSSSSWKMCLDSSAPRKIKKRAESGKLQSDEFLETWPKAGSMRNGTCYLSEMSAARSFDEESSSSDGVLTNVDGTYEMTGGNWSSPLTRDWKGGIAFSDEPRKGQGRLSEIQNFVNHLWVPEILWATPTVHGNNNYTGVSAKAGDGLHTMTRKWVRQLADHPILPDPEILQLGREWRESSGQLPVNIAFKEWLMGLPHRLTHTECSVTESILWSAHMRSELYQLEQDWVFSMTKATVAPIVQWVGGKGQILPALVERLLPKWLRYYEPFFGGGALYFELKSSGLLDSKGNGLATISDLNGCLMDVYRTVLENPEGLIAELKVFEADKAKKSYQENEDTYYAVRKLYNQGATADRDLTTLERSVLFMYLNRMAFNGLYRVNSKGEMNSPFRRNPNRDIVREDAIRLGHRLLQNALVLSGQSYEGVLEYTKPGDFVYLDPPYVPVSETAKHTEYQEGGFGAKDQEGLADYAIGLWRKGVLVMASNADHPAVWDLYKGWNIERVQARRSINSDPDKRGFVNELIIRNY